MSRRAIVIRPEPGLSVSLQGGAAAGLEMTGYPLFEVRAVPWDAPDPAQIDGLLLGSANAVRLGGDQLRNFTHLPVHAVGARTAAVAHDAGFRIGGAGSGGLQQVLDALTGRPIRLLRLAGADHVELAPPAGIEIIERIVYEVTALPMPAEMLAQLRRSAVVLLHSAAAAQHFARECDRLAVARTGVALAALGQRIADAAGEGWRAVQWCEQPQESALLALAQDMCH